MGCQNQDQVGSTPYVFKTRRGSSVQFNVDPRTSRVASRGWKKFISHEALSGGSVLHDGGLLLRCIVEIECREANNLANNSVATSVESLPLEIDSDNFIDSMRYTDFAIEVGGQTYPCHKFLLAQKSSVFEAMFSHANFNEAKDSKMSIEDIPPEGILEMLRFIYTGRVRNMKNVNIAVFAASDKYNIVDLKKATEKNLCESISVNTVCSFLLLAHDHSADVLKKKSLTFISDNVQEVTNSQDWQHVLSQPSLMTEVVRALDPQNRDGN